MKQKRKSVENTGDKVNKKFPVVDPLYINPDPKQSLNRHVVFFQAPEFCANLIFILPDWIMR